MKISTLIKKSLTGACVYYAVFSMLLIVIGIILKGSISDVAISVVNTLLLFPFGLAMTGAQMLAQSKAFSKILRTLLHYLISMVAFFLFLLLPANPSAKGSYYLVGLLLVSLLYWIAFAIVAITKKRLRSFKEE